MSRPDITAPRRPLSPLTLGLFRLAVLGPLVAIGACTTPTTSTPTSSDDTSAGDTVSVDPTTTGDDTTTSTTDGGSSTGTDPTTTSASADDTSGGDTTGEGSSTGEPEPTDCTAPQRIPPGPPIDCSDADGVITTSLIIEDGNDQPEDLIGIRRVEGSVRVNRIDSDNLDFMACLEEVTGDVTIFGNEQLTNVDGLWSLTSIGTDFVFSDNPAIVDFDGLPNLVSIPQNLVIKTNHALQSVSGFHSLVGVENNLLIQNNDALLDIDGLGGLMLVGGVFAVTANPQCCISSINCVGEGIVVPEVPPESWSTQANDNSC